MITTNEIFPSAELQSRINKYNFYELLLKSDHKAAFEKTYNNLFRDDAELSYTYQVINMCYLISKISSDLLFLEPPLIKSEDASFQLELDRIVNDNSLNTVLLETAMGTSCYGDGYIKVYRREDGSVRIMQLKPYHVSPVLNQYKEIESVDVFDFVHDCDTNADFVRVETHMPNLVQYSMFKYDAGKRVTAELINSDFQETGVDSLLVKHVPNIRLSAELLGISDYEAIFTMQEALNRRATQISKVLSKHSSPILSVPYSMLDEYGNIKVKDLEVVALPEEAGGSCEYLTWDGQLESSFNELNSLVEKLIMISDMPSSVIKGSEQAQSAEALKLRMVRTLSMIKRKSLYMKKFVKEVIDTIISLEHSSGNMYDIADYSIEFQDGLPNVNTELNQSK